jgi:hygromycin-B 4-O-kinase
MSTIKSDMDTQTAAAFLQAYWGEPAQNMEAIEQGEVNRAYFFRLREQDYVVRFNARLDGFQKERYLADTFASEDMPIPEIIEIGPISGIYFAISKRAAGTTLIHYDTKQLTLIQAMLIKLFASMNKLEVENTHGLGWVLPSGDGSGLSWLEHVESFFDETRPGFWHGWHNLFEGSFLDKGLFNTLYAKMMKLAVYSQTERYLVHGDFHMGNLIADGTRLTGIIDWELAMYGDYMFDLATFHLWSPHVKLPELYYKHCQFEGREIRHFEERLLSALLIKGLDSLRFYAKTNDEQAYVHVRDDLLRRIAGNTTI